MPPKVNRANWKHGYKPGKTLWIVSERSWGSSKKNAGSGSRNDWLSMASVTRMRKKNAWMRK